MARPTHLGWVPYANRALAERAQEAIDEAAKEYLLSPNLVYRFGVLVETITSDDPRHVPTAHLVGIREEGGNGTRFALHITAQHPDGGPPGADDYHGVEVTLPDVVPDTVQVLVDTRTGRVADLADIGWQTDDE